METSQIETFSGSYAKYPIRGRKVMKKSFKIKSDELLRLLNADIREFPKYTRQLMNLANQNSQATRPRVVGQMSELIQEFPGKELKAWEEWYQKHHPTAIEEATTKIFDMIGLFEDAIGKITRDIVKEWVKDLVITKTFAGLKFQEAILKYVADKESTTYEMATPQEESQNIDGKIGDRYVSIKPSTYLAKPSIPISIKVDIIYYKKMKSGIEIEYDFK